MASSSAEPEPAATKPKAATPRGAETPKEDPDFFLLKLLVNEDICCPVCFRPYFACDLREVEGFKDLDVTSYNYDVPLKEFKEKVKEIPEGYVIPLRLNCNHAICERCARKKEFFEKDVVFLGSGVRCQFMKCDQPGHDPCVCHFLTPAKDVDDISISAENMLVAHALRHVIPIALGVKEPDLPENKEVYYYFKACHYCENKQSVAICTKCGIPVCESCKSKHKDHPFKSVTDYDKEVVQSHKCVKCEKNQAFKYCAVCRKFLCRNRATCYDPCMDPNHLLIEFDPSLIEIKRFEYNAVDNSRKMFIHDAHDYLETDPFFWQAADMESLGRSMFYQEKERCEKLKSAGGSEAAASSSAVASEPPKPTEDKNEKQTESLFDGF